MTKPTDVNVSPPPSAEVGDDEPPDLNSVLLGFTNYVNNERVRSYNEGVDDTIERCARVAHERLAAGDNFTKVVAAIRTLGIAMKPTDAQIETAAWERGFKAAIGPTIERCARVAENFQGHDSNDARLFIAAAIRASKDKT